MQGFLRQNHCLFDCRADSCSAIQSFTLWPVRCLKATLKVQIIDAQRVDVGIVGGALAREIHAEIGAVGAQGLSQLHRRKVGLQVEFVALAAVVQQLTNLLDNGLRQALGRLRAPAIAVESIVIGFGSRFGSLGSSPLRFGQRYVAIGHRLETQVCRTPER